MQQIFRKIKRVQPIIKLKQMKVDEETAVLTAIRVEKIAIVAAMKENQRRYMEGIEQLNKIRTSSLRTNLDTLEDALDFVKSEWYRLYQQVQTVEQREKQQIEQLLGAERELKATQRLEERYQIEFQKSAKKEEQRGLDEFSIRKFNTR